MEWTEKKKEAVIELIFNEIVGGVSVRSIFKNDYSIKLPSRKTFNEWLAEDEELSAHYACACARREEGIFEDMLIIADNQESDVYEDEDGVEHVNHNVIKRAQLRIDTRKWMLGKMRPKKYGDKLVTENTNKNVEVVLTPEENEKLIAELEAEAAKSKK